MLVIRKIEVTRRIFGHDYTPVTDVFARNSAFWNDCMQDKQVMS